MSLLSLFESSGLSLTRVASTNGGEYAGLMVVSMQDHVRNAMVRTGSGSGRTKADTGVASAALQETLSNICVK